jgi:hypothetical protein
VLLPVVDINVGHSSDQELQLSLIKDVDELLGDEFVEAGHERLELLLDSFRDSVLGDRTNAHPKGTDQRNCVAHAPRKTASEWREREREGKRRGRGHVLDVFLLVELGDLDVLAPWDERDRDELAEPLLLGRERVLNDVRDVVVPRKKRTQERNPRQSPN